MLESGGSSLSGSSHPVTRPVCTAPLPTNKRNDTEDLAAVQLASQSSPEVAAPSRSLRSDCVRSAATLN